MLSTDDRFKLCHYASNIRLSSAVCWDPTKFRSPRINEGETHTEHYMRVLEYRNELTAKFNAIQEKIKARYTYRHHRFPKVV